MSQKRRAASRLQRERTYAERVRSGRLGGYGVPRVQYITDHIRTPVNGLLEKTTATLIPLPRGEWR